MFGKTPQAQQFTVYSADTITGQIMGRLDGNIQSWGRTLNGTDSLVFDIMPPILSSATKDRIRSLTSPVSRSLVLDWDGTVIVAGPIWTRVWDGQKLEISCSGLRSLLKFRKVLYYGSKTGSGTLANFLSGNTNMPTSVLTNLMSASLELNNLSLGTIASELVQNATATNLVNAGLPIVYPPVETDSNSAPDFTWNYFDLNDLDTVLTNLTTAEAGPDIDFQPVWSDSTHTAIEYQMLVGTDEDPWIGDDQTIVYAPNAPSSSVQKVTLSEDGSTVATVYWCRGSGSDVDMIIGCAPWPQSDMPLMMQETDYTDVSDTTELSQLTLGNLALTTTPTIQNALTVDWAMAPGLGTFTLGAMAAMNFMNDPWLPDGSYTGRVLALAGDGTQIGTVTLQESLTEDGTGQ